MAKPKPTKRGNPDAPVPGAGPHGGPDPLAPPARRRRDPKSSSPRDKEIDIPPEPLDIDAPEEAADQGPVRRSEPGSEVEPTQGEQLKIGLRRIHDRLSDRAELLKLHLKHYHMSTDKFRRRTSFMSISF